MPRDDNRGRRQTPDRARGNRGGTGRDRHQPPGQDHRAPRVGPAGIERATTRADAPPRGVMRTNSPEPRAKVTEPPLAQDAPIDVPRKVRRQIEKVTDPKVANRLLQHLTTAYAALDERDGRTALPHLRYLKARLPRLGLFREALGVALYLEEQFKEALSELSAYRRLTGATDHNHLVADAIRATGEGHHRIPGLIHEMEADEDTTDEARYEGRIVWASWLADTGDIGAARAVLAPLLDQPPDPDTGPHDHHLRAWYVAADLAARAGDTTTARTLFGRITDTADNYYDTDHRLAALD